MKISIPTNHKHRPIAISENHPIRMNTLLLISLLLVFSVYGKFGSLSLFHVGGTTFLNLKKLSHPVSVKYTYSALGTQTNGIYERLKPLLGEYTDHGDDGYTWNHASLGTVTLSNSTLEMGPFSAPNGEKKYHGWIKSENDYLTEKQETGDEPMMNSVVDILQNHPVRQVSLQIGVQIPKNASTIRDVLINMFRPENRKQILQDSNFEVATSFSKGFLDRLLTQQGGVYTYTPSLDDLYDDFVIRQTLERLGTPIAKAWTFPISECRQMLVGLHYNHPNYAVDLLPFLLAYRHDDPISLHLSNFVKPSKYLLFNEFHGNTYIGVRRAVGIIKASELYGVFISDNLLGQVSNIEKSLIAKIRSKLLDNERVVVKYVTWDPEKCARAHSKRAKELHKMYDKTDVLLGFIGNNLYGLSPLIIPGDSVVWHQRTEHRFNLMGEYNPALINFNIAHLLENKYYEYLYYETFCPGYFPKTVNALDLMPAGKMNVTLGTFLKGIRKEFPNGWVIKGIWDYNTQSDVMHHNHNYKHLLHEMKKAQFLKYVSKVEKQYQGCEPIEDVNIVVRKTAHFMAWRLTGYMKNVKDVLIQEFLELHREFRIEGFGGRFKREWMTDDDHSHKDDKEDHEFYQSKVNGDFQKCIYSMPEKLRATPVTSDVGLLKDLKTVKILETNPGGNGYLYHHDDDLVPMHNDFLKKYRLLYLAETKMQQGLSPEDQMVLIHRLFKQWNITTTRYDNRYSYLKDRILDVENIILTTVDLTRLNTVVQKIPVEITSIGERYAAIKDVMTYLDKDKGTKNFPIGELLHFLATISMTRESMTYHVERAKVLTEFKKSEKNLLDAIQKRLTDLIQPGVALGSLSDQELIVLAKTSIEQMVTIHQLYILNANQSDILHVFDTIFDEINARPTIDWKGALFPAFNESLREVLTAKSVDFIQKSPQVVKDVSKSLLVLRAVRRMGYVIPGVYLTNIVQFWLPSIQNLYNVFSQRDLSSSVVPLYISVTEFVTTMINVFSDHSLSYLDGKTAFDSEYDFLNRTLAHSSKLKDANLIGSAIDALYVLGGDEDQSLIVPISNAREVALRQLDNEDVWKLAGHKSLYATANAFLGLVEHAYLGDFDPSVPSFHLSPLKQYKERLNRINLFHIDQPNGFFVDRLEEKSLKKQKDEL